MDNELKELLKTLGFKKISKFSYMFKYNDVSYICSKYYGMYIFENSLDEIYETESDHEMIEYLEQNFKYFLRSKKINKLLGY